MVEITISYEGGLHCSATHVPSGTVLTTDAPKDNKGKGESFSPTDLIATALGTCMLTVMGMAAQSLQVDMRGSTLRITKEMASTPVRRIRKLTVQIHVPVPLNDHQKQKLMDAALACPVHKSLHPDIEIPIDFSWG